MAALSALDQSFLSGVQSGQPGIDPNITNAAATNGLTSQAVNTLLGFQNDITQAQTDTTLDNAKAQEDQIAANGYSLQQTGYGQEATAYQTAQSIANQNANLELISGDIQSQQEQRQITKTLGSQAADIAGSGFAGGTSALFLYADSAQQGNLATSLTRENAQISAGGFQQAGAAAGAEAAAADVAAAGAATAAQEAGVAVGTDQQAATLAAQQGVSARTNLTNLVAALMNGGNATGGPLGGTGKITPTADNPFGQNIFANPSLIGHTKPGMDPTATVLSGGAPQNPSPFTGAG